METGDKRRRQPEDVPFERARVGLVEVVDVEDEVALGGGVDAEVGEVGVAAELHQERRARPRAERGCHQRGGAPQRGQWAGSHAGMAQRQQLRDPVVPLAAEHRHDVWPPLPARGIAEVGERQVACLLATDRDPVVEGQAAQRRRGRSVVHSAIVAVRRRSDPACRESAPVERRGDVHRVRSEGRGGGTIPCRGNKPARRASSTDPPAEADAESLEEPPLFSGAGPAGLGPELPGARPERRSTGSCNAPTARVN